MRKELFDGRYQFANRIMLARASSHGLMSRLEANDMATIIQLDCVRPVTILALHFLTSSCKGFRYWRAS